MHEPVPQDPLVDSQEPSVERLELAFTQILDSYGLRSSNFNLMANTLPEYLYRRYMYSQGFKLPDGQPDWQEYKEMQTDNAIVTTKHTREALNILRTEQGVDLLKDRRALSDVRKYATCVTELYAAVDKKEQPTSSQEIDERISYLFAVDIAMAFGGRPETYRQAIQGVERELSAPGLTPHDDLQLRSKWSYYSTALKNLSSFRYDTQRQLRVLCSDDITAALDAWDEAYTAGRVERADEQAVTETILGSQKQELDYTILPAGTTIREVAEQIVDDTSEYSKAHIDLERLAVLERVRQHVGPDRCYLMRGKSTGKTMEGENGTLISEDYIGLIMQHHDADGTVVTEDCLAISPIARKHAGYLVRQDVSAGISWREILALPKKDAVNYFEARRLRFDPVSGMDTYEAYFEKAIALLECEPAKFGREYMLQRRNNAYRLVHRGKSLGKLALAKIASA